MHGLRAGTVATIVLTAAFATGAAAVEPMTIPTAAAGVAAPRCTVGQLCTFAAPIFACDYAGAEKIAAAEPTNASVIGTDLMREKVCQIVAAGRPVSTEATKSAQVIHLTENATYLGYMPVGVFAVPSAIKIPSVPFPRELWGRWFDSRRACSDRRREREDYENHGVMVISEWGRSGNYALEYPQRISAVRRLGERSWEIDGTHDVDGLEEPIATTTIYTLTRQGLAMKSKGEAGTGSWVRCR